MTANLRLVLLLHSIIGATLASVAVVVGLVSGLTTIWPLVSCAISGWLVGWPVALFVAKRLNP